MEEDIKNLSEIIELCEEEINNNDENVSAVLDLTDLLSLRRLIKTYKELKEIEETHRKENGELRERVKGLEEENKKFYNGEIYTAKQLKQLEENQNKYFINKKVVKDKIEELQRQFDFYAGREHSEWQDGEFDGEQCDDIALQIRTLQELLEKRK